MRFLRGLLIAWMCLTVAWPADARVAVVTAHVPYDHPVDGNVANSMMDLYSSVTTTLDKMGVPYDVWHSGQANVKTVWCRTGVFPALGSRGTTAGGTQSYDAIIHVRQGLQTYTPRADSLTLIGADTSAARYVNVPNIFVCYGGNGMGESPACSSGAGLVDQTHMTPLGQVNYIPGTDIAFRTVAANVAIGASGLPVKAAGTHRTLMRANQGRGRWSTEASIPCDWCDSLSTKNDSLRSTVNDTMIVWAKALNNITGNHPGYGNNAAAPLVFIQDQDFAVKGKIHSGLLTALAWADSTMGGTILDDATKLPIKLGIQIRGGWSRGSQLGHPASTGGMEVTDSVAFKASIDSIGALNVPFSVIVNTDSLGSFNGYDQRWWSQARTVHYGAGLTLSGSHTYTGLSQRLRSIYRSMDSAFGESKVDRVVVATGDDWSPSNIASFGYDSLVYALAAGGARGVTVNTAKENILGVGYKGYRQSEPVILNTSLGPFKFLRTPGYNDSGSVRFDQLPGALQNIKGLIQPSRFWRSVLNAQEYGIQDAIGAVNSNNWGADSTKSTNARIYTIHAADLQSGTRGDAASLPLRPGWHQLKNIVNQAKAANYYGYRGRKIIQLSYPEDIEP